jgi:acyl carrier protein
MKREEIEKKIRDIIAERSKSQKIYELGSDDPIGDLGIDSLAFSWILADMEDVFGFVMIGSEILKLKTLNNSVDYIEKKLKK